MTKLSVDLNESGAISAQRVIELIVAFAGKQGIDQATLAARAGISAESLSRLKKAGSCRLTTALELARAAGFRILDLTAPVAGHVSALIAARKLSAGRRLPISAEELVLVLASGEFEEQHKVHLFGFLEELSIELVHDVILDENIDYARLVSLAHKLGVEGDTVDWLKEMAGNSMANAA